MFVFVIYLFVLYIGNICYCKLDLSYYDLESITSPTNYTFMTKEANYTFNFRQSLNAEDACMISDCVAQVNLSYNCYCYGLFSTENYDLAGDGESLVFKYLNQGTLQTNMNVFCGTGGISVNPLVKFV
jgi:hypothetical protein